VRTKDSITETTVRELARTVDLTLSDSRVKVVLPQLREILSELQKMDELELNNAELGVIFRARREQEY
jgi:Asp-tRNA(Asn)/Glu-tRNA(Gln) amidotransferase C subunit